MNPFFFIGISFPFGRVGTALARSLKGSRVRQRRSIGFRLCSGVASGFVGLRSRERTGGSPPSHASFSVRTAGSTPEPAFIPVRTIVPCSLSRQVLIPGMQRRVFASEPHSLCGTLGTNTDRYSVCVRQLLSHVLANLQIGPRESYARTRGTPSGVLVMCGLPHARLDCGLHFPFSRSSQPLLTLPLITITM